MGSEQRVPLWDEMEQCFANPEIRQRVRDMQEESEIELSDQSRESALAGEVICAFAFTDEINREFNVSDQGIDMEIDFTDNVHEATGAKRWARGVHGRFAGIFHGDDADGLDALAQPCVLRFRLAIRASS